MKASGEKVCGDLIEEVGKEMERKEEFWKTRAGKRRLRMGGNGESGLGCGTVCFAGKLGKGEIGTNTEWEGNENPERS